MPRNKNKLQYSAANLLCFVALFSAIVSLNVFAQGRYNRLYQQLGLEQAKYGASILMSVPSVALAALAIFGSAKVLVRRKQIQGFQPGHYLILLWGIGSVLLLAGEMITALWLSYELEPIWQATLVITAAHGGIGAAGSVVVIILCKHGYLWNAAFASVAVVSAATGGAALGSLVFSLSEGRLGAELLLSHVATGTLVVLSLVSIGLLILGAVQDFRRTRMRDGIHWLGVFVVVASYGLFLSGKTVEFIASIW